MDAKEVLTRLENALTDARNRGSHADVTRSAAYESGYIAGERSGLGTALIIVHHYQDKLNQDTETEVSHPVWQILNKDMWTEDGVREFEQLHDLIVDLIKRNGLETMRAVLNGINLNLREFMLILSHYTTND